MSPSSILEKFINLNPKTFLISKKAPLNPDVAVYFEGATNNLYQIQQWVLPFTKLKERHSILILARHKPIYDWVNTNTDIPCIYLRTIDDLQTFYDTNTEIKCILYVNHAFKNFQSLINNNALHVHINHGESDKTSTTTNQVKAYDRVFLVADAALNKYTKNLIEFDTEKFVLIGRPQLDGIKQIDKPKPDHTDRKVIIYAPTWEGTHHSMNFSSIEKFGKQIVQTIQQQEIEQQPDPEAMITEEATLTEDSNSSESIEATVDTELTNNPDQPEDTETSMTPESNEPEMTSKYYLIYRPHPRTGTRDPKVKAINNKLKALVKAHPFAHLDETSDSLSLCEIADFAIFDNSAVTVDYLKYDKPFMVSDLFENQEGTRNDKPIITKAAHCIDDANIEQLAELIESELNEDTHREQRAEVKQQFIGNYEEGESTQKFIGEITKVINTRDHLVKERKRRSSAE